MDFGRTAQDYARYRTVFPTELFGRLAALGLGTPGQRVVDLGAGTGTLGRGFASQGCTVTGVDTAPELLEEARRLDAAQGVASSYRTAPAEDTGLPTGAFDLVCAGQCWHWFDGPRAAAEARRLLAPAGALAVCYRDYRLEPGNVCAASEDLVLAHNPAWTMAGGNATHPELQADLAAAGFSSFHTIDFEIVVEFTHETWRGRMRTCNGVGATLPDEAVAAFDADLAQLLRDRFPEEPLRIPHRIWALAARC